MPRLHMTWGAGISASFQRFHGQLYFLFGTKVGEKSEIH